MTIAPVDTDTFVKSEGERVKHFIGMACWCIAGNEGQPKADCQECKGEGYIYEEEKTIVGLITNISFDKKLLESGFFHPGDCVFSPLTGDTVSEHDKIIFTWPTAFGMGDPLVRGNDAVDTLYYEAVKSIYCRDQDRVKYVEGTDFKFTGKQIEWQWDGKPAEGKAPDTGIKYTIKYKAYIEWIVYLPPIQRVSHGEDIGDKVFLRMKHL